MIEVEKTVDFANANTSRNKRKAAKRAYENS